MGGGDTQCACVYMRGLADPAPSLGQQPLLTVTQAGSSMYVCSSKMAALNKKIRPLGLLGITYLKNTRSSTSEVGRTTLFKVDVYRVVIQK